jgi:hypothetical protein
MKFIMSVSLISLLTLSISVMAEAEKSLAECGFPLAGEKFESNLKELLDVTTTPPEIPDYKCEAKLTGYGKLCRTLETNATVEDEDSPYTYEYEQELARLAKADFEKDGDDLFVKKVNAYVTQCSKNLICNTLRTKKEEISLLKVAVATGNIDYFERAIKVYKYPLTTIDDKDSMNIMDFVYEDLEYWKKNFPRSAEVEKSQKMFDTVKQGGGKFHKYSKLNSTLK